MEDKKLINKDKFKVLQIPSDLVLSTIEECKGGFGLPSDSVVQDVRHSWSNDCFEFKINSDSYPEVSLGQNAEKIQLPEIKLNPQVPNLTELEIAEANRQYAGHEEGDENIQD